MTLTNKENVEKLCKGYDIYDNERYTSLLHYKNMNEALSKLKELKSINPQNKYVIYGGIFDRSNFIYIAKMNKEGNWWWI